MDSLIGWICDGLLDSNNDSDEWVFGAPNFESHVPVFLVLVVNLNLAALTLKVCEVDRACWWQALIVALLVYSPREMKPNRGIDSSTECNFCCQSIICERARNISDLRTQENRMFLKCSLVWFEICVLPLLVGRRQDTTLVFWATLRPWCLQGFGFGSSSN